MVSLEELDLRRREKVFPTAVISPTWAEAEVIARMGMGRDLPLEVLEALTVGNSMVTERTIKSALESYQTIMDLTPDEEKRISAGLFCASVLKPWLEMRNLEQIEPLLFIGLLKDLYDTSLAMAVEHVGLLLIRG